MSITRTQLDAAAEALALVLKFDRPADSVLHDFFRAQRALGAARPGVRRRSGLRRAAPQAHRGSPGAGRRAAAKCCWPGWRAWRASASASSRPCSSRTSRRGSRGSRRNRSRDCRSRCSAELPDWIVETAAVPPGWTRSRRARPRAERARAARPARQHAARRARGGAARARRRRHCRRADALFAGRPPRQGPARDQPPSAVPDGRHRGAGRRQPAARLSPCAEAARSRGGFLRRRRRQEPHARRPDAFARPHLCLRRLGGAARPAEAPVEALRPVQYPPADPCATRTTSGSSASPARSTGCWWMRPAAGWARCAAIPDLKWRQSPQSRRRN